MTTENLPDPILADKMQEAAMLAKTADGLMILLAQIGGFTGAVLARVPEGIFREVMARLEIQATEVEGQDRTFSEHIRTTCAWAAAERAFSRLDIIKDLRRNN